jgi:hypothetical protein
LGKALDEVAICAEDVNETVTLARHVVMFLGVL